MATIDTSLFPSANVRFQMAEAPSGIDFAAIQQQKLANQVTAQNLETAKRNAQRQKMIDAMRDVMGHETPEDAITAIDRHVASGDMTPEQAADAKSKVPTRAADGSLPQGAMTAWRQRNFDDYLATNEQLYESQTRRQQQQQMQDIMGMGAAPATAPTNALAPAPADQEQALFNQLNPSATAPAVAPTNALIPQTSTQTPDANVLRRQITQLNMMGTAPALAQARYLEGLLPQPATQTEFDKKWALFQKQYPNGTYEQFVKLSQSPAASTTLVMPPTELAEKKAWGEQLVKDYSEGIKPAADQARKNLATVDVLQNLLDKGLQTGWSTQLEGQVRNALTKMGVEGAKDLAGDIQTFQAFVRQNVLNEQMKQKGVQTEGDAQRIQETFANLSNTPDANKFLVAVRRVQLNRDIAQQKFWTDWKSKHGTFDGAEEAWINGEGSTSIFDSPSLKKYTETKPVTSPSDTSKQMPTGAKLTAYAKQHFNGDEAKAKKYLTSQGYR